MDFYLIRSTRNCLKIRVFSLEFSIVPERTMDFPEGYGFDTGRGRKCVER